MDRATGEQCGCAGSGRSCRHAQLQRELLGCASPEPGSSGVNFDRRLSAEVTLNTTDSECVSHACDHIYDRPHRAPIMGASYYKAVTQWSK